MGADFSCCESAQKTVEELKDDVQQKGVAAVMAEKVVEVASAIETKLDEAVAAQEAAAQGAAKAGEAVESTIDAAVAAVTGILVLRFVDPKGTEQHVDFKTKKLGFVVALSGGGCCGKSGKAKVAVKKVDKGSQAESLGVKAKWVLTSVNGIEITGLAQAQQQLKCGAEALADAA